MYVPVTHVRTAVISALLRQASLFLLWLAAAVPCVAQLPTKPTEEVEIDRQEIVNLEMENARAIQNHDTTFFKRVYGDDFIGIFSAGQTIRKSGLLVVLQSPLYRYDFVKVDDVVVRLYGEFAIATCHRLEKGNINGEPFNRQYRVTHIYINGQRGWKVVSGQETLILPGPQR